MTGEVPSSPGGLDEDELQVAVYGSSGIVKRGEDMDKINMGELHKLVEREKGRLRYGGGITGTHRGSAGRTGPSLGLR